MGNLEFFTLKDSEKWRKLLHRLPMERRDIYFTPEYYRIYEKLGDGEAICFAFSDDRSLALYPFLRNSVNSLGYDLDREYYDIQGAYGYNGVVTNDDSPDFKQRFFKAFKEYCRESFILAEFTRFHPLLNNIDFSHDYLDTTKDRETVFIDLTKPYDSLWMNDYTSTNRNMIRKARKNRFTIEIEENPTREQIEGFKKIYQGSMRAIGAKEYYLFKDEYFRDIFSELGPCALLFKVINTDHEIECAAIFIIYGIYAHYHLSGRKRGSDNSVNNFMLDEAVQYAQGVGVKKINLGGGNTAGGDDPLLKFKMNFSKSAGDFFIGKHVHRRNVYDEVVRQWEKKNPEKALTHKNILLKYRY